MTCALRVDSGELSRPSAYTATETALVECVEGNPYSSAADPDMVIRWSGGERGRGRHNRSFKKPLQKTPDARMCTNLYGSCQPRTPIRASVPNTYPRPMLGDPHQKRNGRKTMKNVCVPRLAVNAK